MARGDPNQGALDHGAVTTPQHRADRFLEPESDPREGGTSLGDERATLIEYLRGQRLTLQLKCQGLDADQLARRSVEPSTLSLLGLVRHMAEVERNGSGNGSLTRTSPIGISPRPSRTVTSTVLWPIKRSSMRHGPHGVTRLPLPSSSPARPTSASSDETARVSPSPYGSSWFT